jgi:hypothetical protein
VKQRSSNAQTEAVELTTTEVIPAPETDACKGDVPVVRLAESTTDMEES